MNKSTEQAGLPDYLKGGGGGEMPKANKSKGPKWGPAKPVTKRLKVK